jgi:hypothetical protein
MSFTDSGDGLTIWEMVGNGRSARDRGNAGVCLEVTFGVGGVPCEGYDKGEDTAGRDIATVATSRLETM